MGWTEPRLPAVRVSSPRLNTANAFATAAAFLLLAFDLSLVRWGLFLGRR
jgi:hypothetical protein